MGTISNFNTQKKGEKNKNRDENIKLESDIEAKRTQTNIRIENKKDEKNYIIKQICDIEKEISDLNLDLELHNNYGTHSNIENVVNEIEKSAKKKKCGKKK